MPFYILNYFSPSYFQNTYWSRSSPTPFIVGGGPYFPAGYFNAAYYASDYFDRLNSIPIGNGHYFSYIYFPSPYFDNIYFDRSQFIPKQFVSSIRDTFQAFRLDLVNNGLFDDALAIVSLSEDEFPQSGTVYCLICPHDFFDNDPFTTGGGRNVTVLSGQFSVIIRTRNRLDTPYRDGYLILNQDSTGILNMAHGVINVLQLCFPEDAAGNLLVSEPPRVLSVSKASRAGTQGEWGGVKIMFEVSIELTLPLAV